MSERNIVVWGRTIRVTVEQRLKTVWVVSGDYLGKSIVTEDRTEGAALRRWKEAAASRGG